MGKGMKEQPTSQDIIDDLKPLMEVVAKTPAGRLEFALEGCNKDNTKPGDWVIMINVWATPQFKGFFRVTRIEPFGVTGKEVFIMRVPCSNNPIKAYVDNGVMIAGTYERICKPKIS